MSKQEKRTNEELVALYKEGKDERYLAELISKNTGLLNMLVDPYLESIPFSEREDLIQESYIPMLKAIEDFDPTMQFSFTTLLKAYVRQKLNRLYNEATRKKRYTGSTPVSYEGLEEINKEGGDITESSFTVECEDIKSVEFNDLLNSIKFTEKEKVVVKILMDGGSNGECAERLKCTPATVSYYFGTVRKKLILAGVSF